MQNILAGVSRDMRVQSLNAISAGFGFAAALAWLDFIRWIISSIIRVKANGGSYFLMSALLTTLLAVICVMLIMRFGGSGLRKPDQTVYAVTK
jgi:hypothetical protein